MGKKKTQNKALKKFEKAVSKAVGKGVTGEVMGQVVEKVAGEANLKKATSGKKDKPAGGQAKKRPSKKVKDPSVDGKDQQYTGHEAG